MCVHTGYYTIIYFKYIFSRQIVSLADLTLNDNRVSASLGCYDKTLQTPTLSGLNSRNLFPHSSGGQQSELRVPAWLESVEDSYWLADGHPTLCCLLAFPLCFILKKHTDPITRSHDLL